MATFVSTIQFTNQGLRDIKATRERADEFRVSAEAMGVSVKNIYWTLGPFDGLIIFDAPDQETAAALMMQLGSQGNVQTQTSRAYEADDVARMLGQL